MGISLRELGTQEPFLEGSDDWQREMARLREIVLPVLHRLLVESQQRVDIPVHYIATEAGLTPEEVSRVIGTLSNFERTESLQGDEEVRFVPTQDISDLQWHDSGCASQNAPIGRSTPDFEGSERWGDGF